MSQNPKGYLEVSLLKECVCVCVFFLKLYSNKKLMGEIGYKQKKKQMKPQKLIPNFALAHPHIL